MKAEIRFSGEIFGVGRLVSKMNLYSGKREGLVNRVILKYDTITDAKKDIAKAYSSLKQELKEMRLTNQIPLTKEKDNSEMRFSLSSGAIYVMKPMKII